jgi:hypothetical protein
VRQWTGHHGPWHRLRYAQLLIAGLREADRRSGTGIAVSGRLLIRAKDVRYASAINEAKVPGIRAGSCQQTIMGFMVWAWSCPTGCPRPRTL